MLRNERQYKYVIAAVIATVVVLLGFAWYFGPGQRAARGDATAEAVVESFGAVLKNVPLLAESDVVAGAIQEHYAPYITPELLAQWLANPKLAPGRLTSSPSPDRIGVATVVAQGSGRIITGEIIYTTSAEAPGEAVDTVPFIAQVVPTDNGWRIAAFEDEEVKTLKNLPKTDEDIPGAR